MNAGVTQVETGGRSAAFMNRDGTRIEDRGWLSRRVMFGDLWRFALNAMETASEFVRVCDA